MSWHPPNLMKGDRRAHGANFGFHHVEETGVTLTQLEICLSHMATVAAMVALSLPTTQRHWQTKNCDGSQDQRKNYQERSVGVTQKVRVEIGLCQQVVAPSWAG